MALDANLISLIAASNTLHRACNCKAKILCRIVPGNACRTDKTESFSSGSVEANYSADNTQHVCCQLCAPVAVEDHSDADIMIPVAWLVCCSCVHQT